MAQVTATGAEITLGAPAGLALAPDGTTFISDTAHGRIVRISPQGAASVLPLASLTPPLAGPTALALDAAGNLYIADTGNSRVVRVAASGGAEVVDTGSVTLGSPRGVAIDPSGNLYIADTGHNQIVSRDSAGNMALVTASASVTLASPEGLAFNAAGMLYIADSGNNRIVIVAPGSGTGAVLSFSWDVLPTGLSSPSAIALDRNGNLFIADRGNNRILVVDYSLKCQDLNTGGWGLVPTAPGAVAVDIHGAVHIADTGNDRVVAATMPLIADASNADYLSSRNRTAVNFGHVTLGSATSVTLTLPVLLPSSPNLGSMKVFTSGTENLDFTLGAGTTAAPGVPGPAQIEVRFRPTAAGQRKGALVLYDDAAHVIMTLPLVAFADAPLAALSPNLGFVLSTGTLPTSNPYQMAIDGAGVIYSGNYSSKSVTRTAPGGGGTALVALGAPNNIAVQNITGVALDGAGNLFVGDHQNSRILVVTPAGEVSVLSISGLSPVLGFPTALAFDGAGNLLVADFTTGRILQVSNLKVQGGTARGQASVLSTAPYLLSASIVTGLAVDPCGAFYVAARTSNNSSIIKVTPSGAASKLSVPGITLLNPQGVASDAMGNIYVVDTGHNTIVRVTATGEASSLAISGLPLPATTLGSTLFGVTVDPSGNLFIPDWTNNRLVCVNVSAGALTFAATKRGAISSDSPKAATVTNLGNQPLVFATDPTYTADFSWNLLDPNPITSGTALGAGATGNLSVQFTPQSVGNLSAGIQVTNNSRNASGSIQQVSVSGTGISPGDVTATTVTLEPAPLTNGQAVTLTATLVNLTSGPTGTVPTGAVTFTDTVGGATNPLNNGAAVPLSDGKAVLSGVVLSGVGTHTITATYAGVSMTFLASTGSSSVDVVKASVALLGPATAPTATLPEMAALSATLTGPYTTLAAPTGAIGWSILDASGTSVASGSANLTAGATSSTAAWSIPTPLLGAGTYTVKISYDGDANYLPMITTSLYSLVISKAAPAVLLASSANPSLAQASVAFTASVTGAGATPTGSVSFYDGATLLGTAALADGKATCATANLVPGAHAITAVYAGDASFTALTSAAVSQVIQQVVSAVTLTSSSSTGSDAFGLAVTFTATVTNAGGFTPTGTITFLDGATALATVPLANGSASYTTSALALGAHSVTASYSGDGPDQPGVSSAVTQTTTQPVVVVPVPPAPVTIANGGAATTQLTLASQGTLGAPVTFTVTGLPAGATCTFDNPSVVVTGTPVTVTATITTTPRLQILGKLQDPLSLGGAGAGALVLGGLFAVPSRRRKRVGLFLSALALLFVGGLTACGGGTSAAKGITTGTSGTPAGSYQVTIIASSQGVVQATATFTLTVN